MFSALLDDTFLEVFRIFPNSHIPWYMMKDSKICEKIFCWYSFAPLDMKTICVCSPMVKVLASHSVGSKPYSHDIFLAQEFLEIFRNTSRTISFWTFTPILLQGIYTPRYILEIYRLLWQCNNVVSVSLKHWKTRITGIFVIRVMYNYVRHVLNSSPEHVHSMYSTNHMCHGLVSVYIIRGKHEWLYCMTRMPEYSGNLGNH